MYNKRKQSQKTAQIFKKKKKLSREKIKEQETFRAKENLEKFTSQMQGVYMFGPAFKKLITNYETGKIRFTLLLLISVKLK